MFPDWRLEQLKGDGASQYSIRINERLGMAQSKISDICRGRRGVTPDMAMRLGRLFGQSPRFWLNLQENWELSRLDEAVYSGIEPIHLAAGA